MNTRLRALAVWPNTDRVTLRHRSTLPGINNQTAGYLAKKPPTRICNHSGGADAVLKLMGILEVLETGFGLTLLKLSLYDVIEFQLERGGW